MNGKLLFGYRYRQLLGSFRMPWNDERIYSILGVGSFIARLDCKLLILSYIITDCWINPWRRQMVKSRYLQLMKSSS